jgi:hypothetical protein
MPTVTQRHEQANEMREGIAPGFIPGTECTYPSRTDKRRLIRAAKHKAALQMRRLLRG